MATLQQQLPGVVLGEITGVTADGQPLVRTGSRRSSRPALATVMHPQPEWRHCTGKRVVLAFVDADPDRPVVLGLLDAPAVTTPATASATPRTLCISAGEELSIECGKSKIHLRADGRIEIRGEHVISRSRGPNKVKGGSVHIN